MKTPSNTNTSQKKKSKKRKKDKNKNMKEETVTKISMANETQKNIKRYCKI